MASKALTRSSIEMISAGARAYLMPRGALSEDRLLWALVILSAAAHLAVLLFDFRLLAGKPPVLAEDSVDVDILADADLTPPLKSTLPLAAPAPEAKVPAQLLPQLPKQYSVKEEEKPEETLAEEAQVAPPKEEAKPAPVEKTEEHVIKTENKVDNQIEESELLKRAALEKLRKEAKFADKTEAPEKSDLAAVADALTKIQHQKGPTTGSAAAKGRANAYASRVRKAVKANYAVPEAYNLQNAEIEVVLLVSVSERGDLLTIDLDHSSGDTAFDTMAIDAVRASAPLPQPPKELVGEAIKLVFSPKTL